jgi:D-3-phosphoglycerate dehydrogenase
VEAGKKTFAGVELRGRMLGVIGLGAIGRLVADAGVALGMRVLGHDPGLTIDGAWRLSAGVRKAESIDALVRASDFVTCHVPLGHTTRHLINAERVALMKDGAVILNFAREGVVDDAAVIDGLRAGKVGAYVCDFPTRLTSSHPQVIALPHLGASTREATDHCAVMVADEVRAFLEDGDVRHAVNFPEVVVPRDTPHRLVCAHANVPTMLGQISEALGQADLNIHDMANRSRGDLAYTVVDLDAPVPDAVVTRVASITGVLMARVLEPPDRGGPLLES